MHETHMGEDGVGATHNNVCGIMYSGSFARYDSIEDGLADCERVVKGYEPWTIKQMSQRWTTTQQDEWFNNVTYFYNQVAS